MKIFLILTVSHNETVCIIARKCVISVFRYVYFRHVRCFLSVVNKVRFTIKEVYKGEKWDDTCITAVITRWEEDSKKEKHVGGGGGYAFDDEGNILK